MDSSVSRRGFLGRAAAVAGAGALASLAGCMMEDGGASMGQGGPMNAGAAVSGDVTPALSPEMYEDRFDEIIDLTSDLPPDLQADPTGEEPIDDALTAGWDDDTLLVLPQGQYKMNRGFRRTRYNNAGLIGQHAVIRHGAVDRIDGHTVLEGEYEGGTMMFRIGTSANPHGDLVFGGLIFDWSWHENAGMQGLNAFVDGRAEIRNIVFAGLHSLGTHGNMRVATATPDSFALVDGVEMREGGLHYINTINERATERYDGSVQIDEEGEEFGQSWSTTGLTGHPDQRGTCVFRNVVCGPWSGSPIYVRGGEGRKIVMDSLVSNGGGNQIRTSGGDDWEPIPEIDEDEDGDLSRDGPYGQSTIENCSVWVDRTPEGVHQVQRGFLLQDAGDHVIRNCSVELMFAEGSGAGGSYGIGTRGSVGDVSIEGTEITLHEEMDAVYVSPRTTGSVELRDSVVNAVGFDPGSEISSLLGGTSAITDNVAFNRG
jgi:hypothetical protein